MGERTAIRWTSRTWNPVTGCSKVSEGCDNCYAADLAPRLVAMGQKGYTTLPWTHENAELNVVLRPERLEQPLHWRQPGRVFVNSMSDLHHHLVPVDFLDRAYDVMAQADRHVFQILTKRPKRLADYVLGWLERRGLDAVPGHIWLGTSIETDRWTQRADQLRRVPVDVRFISAEPLLGPLPSLDLRGLAWIIVGGESGPRFRPMDVDWARDLRDRCVDHGVAFYYKQSGGRFTETGQTLDGERWEQYPDVNPFPDVRRQLRGVYGDVLDDWETVTNVTAADVLGL